MEHDLTEEEIAYLKSASAVPDEVKSFVARQHEQIGLRTGAYMKIAAAAKAEADALLSVRLVAAVKGQLADLAEERKARITAESTVRELRGALGEKDHQIQHLTALPAMAVHSED